MTKYADDLSEWRLRPFWPYVVVAMPFTLAAVFFVWHLLNDGKIWLAFGTIAFSALIWWCILVPKHREYLNFNKIEIHRHNGSKIGNKDIKLEWKRCSSLSFDLYHGYKSAMLIRLVFHSATKSKSSVPVPFLLWPQVLCRLNYINALAGKTIASKRELFLSFVKTLGKIIADLLILLTLFPILMICDKLGLSDIIMWIMVIIYFIILILWRTKIHVPSYYE